VSASVLEAQAVAAEAKRLSRSNSAVSVRRAIELTDARERTVVRDTTTASFEGDGLPLDRMTEIVEARDPARPPTLPRRATNAPRNAPCPCGSDRKYKKCCGNSA
jgi:SEC-C motif